MPGVMMPVNSSGSEHRDDRDSDSATDLHSKLKLPVPPVAHRDSQSHIFMKNSFQFKCTATILELQALRDLGAGSCLAQEATHLARDIARGGGLGAKAEARSLGGSLCGRRRDTRGTLDEQQELLLRRAAKDEGQVSPRILVRRRNR